MMNQKRSTPKHITIKMAKVKERILRAEREKQLVTYKGNSIRPSAEFSAEILQARRVWQYLFRVLEGMNLNREYSAWQGYHSELKER